MTTNTFDAIQCAHFNFVQSSRFPPNYLQFIDEFFQLNLMGNRPILEFEWFTSSAHVISRGSRISFGISRRQQNALCFRANFMTNAQSANASRPPRLGYAMPAEWERHEATWLAWPHHEADWPGKMEAIRWVYGEMVRKISPDEIVRILVRHEAEEKLARQLSQARGLRFEERPVHRASDQPRLDARQRADFCRTSTRTLRSDARSAEVRTSETAIVHFHFNAWAKHDDWQKDRKVPEMAARVLRKKLFHAECDGKPFVLEGGGIEVNGRGTLLTTEECYLHPKIQVRNPGLTRGAIRRDV